MAEEKVVSLRPDTYTEGGGLIDDVDATVADVRFIQTDYQGAMVEPVPVAKIVFDVDGEEHEVLYSVGGKDDFAPSETGRSLISLKGKTALTKTAKFSMLMDSIVAAGFPLDKMEDDMSYLIGLNVHVLRQVVKYSGLTKRKDERENTVLLVTKINKLPWENDKAKGKGKGKAKGKAVDEELAEAVAGVIQEVIIDNDGEVAKKVLLTALIKSDAVKELDSKAAIKLANDDAYLKERDEWVFENGLLKLA